MRENASGTAVKPGAHWEKSKDCPTISRDELKRSLFRWQPLWGKVEVVGPLNSRCVDAVRSVFAVLRKRQRKGVGAVTGQ